MTPKNFTSPAPIHPSAKGSTSTAIPTRNPNMLPSKKLYPWIAFNVTPHSNPDAISQFGILLTLKSKNADSPLITKIAVSVANCLKHHYLLTAEAYTSSKILSTNFVQEASRDSQGTPSAFPDYPYSGDPSVVYEAESQAVGVPTQAVTLLQPLAKPLPMSVSLIATQKTKATRTTINVYSTRP